MITLTKMEVANILQNAFGNLMGPDFPKRTIIADDVYESVDIGLLLKSIETDPVLSPGMYRRDVFDCDDYVMYLKTKMSLFAQNHGSAPIGVGILLTEQHAFNIGIDEHAVLHIINTQSADRGIINDIGHFGEWLRLSNTNIIQLLYI
jgi:hypothetical protein